ncbi:flavohemoglobin expression-modulating QEGLA motif protein [Devosia sediminis]|uniref:Flavohemoglobin expression-modulating QEGLA motif protein n=1 Tax=Devosia sediminis TaxID=2798801 RepID=A0A934J366_9HYPH|nr:flavohemoglobin expression-modulating QEGLA motif protein [Devosia sediminis]MBJ3786839.1 flavohemoglobin expression-modulating QEGLA motif protein [Devosia sediminis]
MSGQAGTAGLDLDAIAKCLETDGPIRLDLGGRGRLYMDRPMPFLAVHVGRRADPVARAAAMANSAHLLVRNLQDATRVINLVGPVMQERFGGFLVVDLGELAADDRAEDAPYLAPFEVSVSATAGATMQAALADFVAALEKVDLRYRAPHVTRREMVEDRHAGLAQRLPKYPVLTVRFAPIYKVPKSRDTYPELRERLVEAIFDGVLQATASFIRAETSLSPVSHRSLGRRVFIDAVSRADRAVDEVASRFDFLLAVTPINAEPAWQEFNAAGFKRKPTFLYRPLTVDIAESKRALWTIKLDHFEDPVLSALYSEKQQELDLQLSMLAARGTRRFRELGRALYRSVEPRLLKAAEEIMTATASSRSKNEAENVDYRFVERRAQAMIERYAGQSSSFAARIEVRDDLPAGMMVSNGRLLISRNTAMAKDRVEALLSHEVGVHLLTYYNGSGHGLRLFRAGLAGYEGAQEGLAVLAEYLAGGMTVPRLRLIAGRVLAVSAMLDGASFVDVYASLTRDHGFSDRTAFTLALRVYRGGGLAKDAIYLRGLLELLRHLEGGGSLDPFWLGKIAAGHIGVMQELTTRGLLKPPVVTPQFLSIKGADQRLDRLRSGLSPIDLVAA